jgi:iron complex outermembrane recepter protein
VYFVPTTTLVDLKVGGQFEHFFWSAAVQNIFDVQYYDYGLDTSFPGFPFYSFYPQPGRTYLVKAGATW